MPVHQQENTHTLSQRPNHRTAANRTNTTNTTNSTTSSSTYLTKVPPPHPIQQHPHTTNTDFTNEYTNYNTNDWDDYPIPDPETPDHEAYDHNQSTQLINPHNK